MHSLPWFQKIALQSHASKLLCSDEQDVLAMPSPQYTGYFFTYYNTRITEERKAQIERINEQVQLCHAGCHARNHLSHALTNISGILTVDQCPV